MSRIFLILLISIFVFGGINAAGLAQICIDLDPPSLLNSSLTLTATNNNINLNWIAATDTPDCSGIDRYDIYRGFNGEDLIQVSNTINTNYLDEDLPFGTYTYMIHAWDLAGQNEGEFGISNTITIGISSVPSGGGGGGGSSSSYWECGEWSECINGTQERTCEDVTRLQEDRIETKVCFPEFIPLGEDETPTETEETQSTPARFFSAITGAVIGTFGTGGTTVVVVFITLIGIVTGFIIARNYKLRNP